MSARGGGAERPGRALVLEHQADAPAGLLGDWLRERGFEVLVRHPEDGPLGEPDGLAMVAALGSEHGVGDGHAWVEEEIRFLQACIRKDVPVLGLCFGGQTLAAALGASVTRAERGEIGWITLDDAEGEVPAGPWFAFHFDRFELPAGASLLGRTAVCPHAYRVGRHLGVQFHPEVTPEIVEGWLEAFPQALDEVEIDRTRLMDRTRREDEAARRRAFDLFDGFWRRARESA